MSTDVPTNRRMRKAAARLDFAIEWSLTTADSLHAKLRYYADASVSRYLARVLDAPSDYETQKEWELRNAAIAACYNDPDTIPF